MAAPDPEGAGTDGLRDISAIRATDSLTNPEIYTRLLATGFGVALLHAGFDLPLILPWFALYVAGLLAHCAIVRVLPTRVGPIGMTILVLSVAMAHVSFAVGIFYLWTRPDQLLQIVAVAGVGIAMLHTQMALRHDTLMLIADASMIAIGLATMGLWQILGRGDVAGGLAFLGIFAAIFGYYLFSILENGRVRQRLVAATAETAQMEKSAAIGRLTGGVAHDFNNMLTAILGNLDLLAETSEAREREALVAEARVAAQQAARIVAQLLAFSRKARLELVPVDLRRALGEVRFLLVRLMPESVHVAQDVPARLPPVRSDPGRLQSVVLNLCINARDAMEGRGALRLEAAQRHVRPEQVRRTDGWLSSGTYVALSVTDTGPGIPASIRERVFEPFYTTKAVGEGSGLGLSMAQGFLEQSGGAITLEDAQEGGTRVVLWLPVA